MSAATKVAVVGGGVVGLCLVEALTRRGAEVVLLEASTCGAGASAGNAGLVTPAFSNPLPAPGTVAKAGRWLFSPNSPLLVHPAPQPSFVRWLYDFWRSSSPRRYSAGMAAVVALSQRAVADFDALAARGVTFETHRQGILFVSRDEAVIEAKVKVLEDLRSLGYRGAFEVLDQAGTLAHEPAISADFTAGILIASDDFHLRPESLTSGLVAHLRGQGTDLREHTRVRSILSTGRGWSLDCGEETIEADRVVLANGVGAARLIAPLEVQMPIQGGKGYSITVTDPPFQLQRPVYMLDRTVTASSYDGALRLSGSMELGSNDLRIGRGGLNGILRAGGTTFRDWSDDLDWSEWAGFRSMLPDGLPVIGPVPGYEGLTVAAGHGLLGVTLAPTTAELLAPIVLDGRPTLEVVPFSIARFDNRGRVADKGARV